MLLPLLRHVVPLNDGNCRLTIPVVKGHCSRYALPHSFNIDVFETVKNNSTTIIHIYNASANFTDNCDVAFDTNRMIGGINQKQRQWSTWECMVPCARLSYTQDYLPPVICSLIKPAASRQNHHSHVIMLNQSFVWWQRIILICSECPSMEWLFWTSGFILENVWHVSLIEFNFVFDSFIWQTNPKPCW